MGVDGIAIHCKTRILFQLLYFTLLSGLPVLLNKQNQHKAYKNAGSLSQSPCLESEENSSEVVAK